MRRLSIAAAIAIASISQPAAAFSEENCTIFTELSTAAYGMRLNGSTEREVSALNDVTGPMKSVIDMAIYRAFDESPEYDPDEYWAETFYRCRMNQL